MTEPRTTRPKKGWRRGEPSIGKGGAYRRFGQKPNALREIHASGRKSITKGAGPLAEVLGRSIRQILGVVIGAALFEKSPHREGEEAVR
jgi:hypothetical protein